MKGLMKDTVVYGATIISKFLNWLLAPFCIRAYLASSAEYGIVMTNLYAWVSVVLVVLTLGLETEHSVLSIRATVLIGSTPPASKYSLSQ